VQAENPCPDHVPMAHELLSTTRQLGQRRAQDAWTQPARTIWRPHSASNLKSTVRRLNQVWNRRTYAGTCSCSLSTGGQHRAREATGWAGDGFERVVGACLTKAPGSSETDKADKDETAIRINPFAVHLPATFAERFRARGTRYSGRAGSAGAAYNRVVCRGWARRARASH
jgi:hypothetical protein